MHQSQTVANSMLLSTPSPRKLWVDVLRGLCMVLILFDHSELYYAQTNIVPYALYVPDALICFFFLSGYLFCKGGVCSFRGKLNSILQHLLLPYFLFSLLMAMPKALAHGKSLAVLDLLLPILMGNASWFIPALIVGELLFLLLLRMANEKPLVLYALAMLCFFGAPWLQDAPISLPWQLPNALQAVGFMALGDAFRRYEATVLRFLTPWRTASLVLLLILVKVYIGIAQPHIMIAPIRIGSYPAFLLTVLSVPFLAVRLLQLLPSSQCLAWIGRHTLALCFLSGGVPLLVSAVFRRMGYAYNGNYLLVVCLFFLVLLLACAAAAFIHRFLPFLLRKGYGK